MTENDYEKMGLRDARLGGIMRRDVPLLYRNAYAQGFDEGCLETDENDN